jgi:uncharacterized membrane protein
MRLLINADGVIETSEYDTIKRVTDFEKIPEETLISFEKDALTKRERELYQTGIDYINQCSDEEKLNAFVHLYKLSEADGKVHVKEVRLLLYSIKMAKIEFNEVVAKAKGVTYP